MRTRTPRLCLVMEPAGTNPARAQAALAAARFASLVVAPAGGGRLVPAEVAPLVEAAQRENVAALVQDDTDLALALAADGVHLTWSANIAEAYDAARARLGTGRIVGADTGSSRHDAMVLGEKGADYIAFGIPAHVSDPGAVAADRRDLVAWWAEIFEPPCMALGVATPEEARGLFEAGADFVAVHLPADLAPEDIARWARGFEEAAARAPAVA